MSKTKKAAAPVAPNAWTWPAPPLSNRYGTTVTEVMDLAADGRRVAVIEGAIWPTDGAAITVHDDGDHVRRGTVARVELVLGYRAPARILVWAELVREAV
jgi:hypothetical protein